MTLGDKLAKLRKEHGYTQEQLAEILGVSRQAISKWESDSAYPETEKLIRLAKMYHTSLDYLLLDREEEKHQEGGMQQIDLRSIGYERVSEKKIGNLPLWHINIGYGRVATGVFAIGLAARGIVSVGLASVGVVSFGVLAVGLAALGCLSVGLLSIGAIGVGILALGAIAVGIFSMGALAVGQFAVGAAAMGNFAAFGDAASAAVAVGRSEAYGSAYQILLQDMTGSDFQQILRILEETVPGWLQGWIPWFLAFLK